MVILHIILLDFQKVPANDLLEDVEKSQEIFRALKRVKVARRCAELTQEILEVAKVHLRGRAYRQNTQKLPEMMSNSTLPTPNQYQTSAAAVAVELYDGQMAVAPPTGGEIWQNDCLMTNVGQEGPVLERANMPANSFDLEDFPFGGIDGYDIDFISSDEMWINFAGEIGHDEIGQEKEVS